MKNFLNHNVSFIKNGIYCKIYQCTVCHTYMYEAKYKSNANYNFGLAKLENNKYFNFILYPSVYLLSCEEHMIKNILE